MPGLRRSLLLLAAAALACTGRVEPASAPAPAPAEPTRGAAAPAEEIPADPADALAATLTEDKLKRLLAFEEALLPTSAALIALASTSGATRTPPGEPTRAERQRALEGQMAELLQRHGLTRADHAGYGALTGGLVLRSAQAEDAKAQLAKNAERKKAWTKANPQEAKKKHDPRWAPDQDGKGANGPIPEALEHHLEGLVSQSGVERAAFASRHGAATLALIDRYRTELLAVREKQVQLVVRSQ
jgi:hypothetical protein